ncbi:MULTISPECIES: restriction endonuclease subunit S [Aeromonas]|uniref:restriction endonuclease subunit S n=1 Tax=Aeromonas TaxID=642 RepID=UPI002442D587|nr:restriction endonuclease subunit S [Aeromonas dhakensis]
MMSELDVLNDNHTSISLSTPSVSGISKIHKGVPKDWAKGTTKDLIDHMSSGLSRRLVENDIGIPVLISGNIQNNKLVVDELKYWYSDDPQGAKIENYVLNEGDILLCFINSLAQIGKPCVYRDIGRPAIYTTNLFRIIIDKSCDGRFAYYLFCTDTFQKDLQLIAKTAVNQASFTKPDFLNINICYPINIKEQTAIANVLSDSDALIDALEQLIAKKQAIKSATMQQLLTGRTRLPAFALRPDGTPKGYKPSELGDIPEDWEILSLAHVTNCLDNLRVPLNESQRLKMRGEIPYCGANGIVGWVNDFLIDDDVILMAEDGGYFDEYVTRPIAYRIVGKCWVNNHAHILKAQDGYEQGYIFYSLVHKDIQRYLASGTRAKLNKAEMEKIEILIPIENQEQTAIATILSDMDNELEALTQKLEKARALKQGMMQQLLTGKIRLPLAVGA